MSCWNRCSVIVIEDDHDMAMLTNTILEIIRDAAPLT